MMMMIMIVIMMIIIIIKINNKNILFSHDEKIGRARLPLAFNAPRIHSYSYKK